MTYRFNSPLIFFLKVCLVFIFSYSLINIIFDYSSSALISDSRDVTVKIDEHTLLKDVLILPKEKSDLFLLKYASGGIFLRRIVPSEFIKLDNISPSYLLFLCTKLDGSESYFHLKFDSTTNIYYLIPAPDNKVVTRASYFNYLFIRLILFAVVESFLIFCLDGFKYRSNLVLLINILFVVFPFMLLKYLL